MKVMACLYCGNKGLEMVTHRSDNNGILRCQRCGTMMVENLSDDYEQLYTADYFEKKEATKNGYTNYLSSPAGNMVGKYAFTRLFARHPGNHLDLGCADGSLMEIFVSEGFDSHGLEISKDAVAIAQSKGLDVHFSKLDVFPKDLPKSRVITAFDLLEHADKPGVVLRGIYDNLEDDGYFVFSTLSVKHNDPSDYWFNNSLEHYVYYNRENLTFILTEVFGKDNFAFVEEDINGIAEFWGFAKKGTARQEKALIKQIAAEEFDPKDPESGFLLSLFYDQVSRFALSHKINAHFKKDWAVGTYAEAEFYNNYFQGWLGKALELTQQNRHLIAASRSIFWQTFSRAEADFNAIRQKDIVDEYNIEVLSLRSDLFKVRDELHALKNSRVLGRVIKARSTLGDSVRRAVPTAKHVARRGLHKTRRTVAKVLPPPVSRGIMRTLRAARQQVRNRRSQPMQWIRVANETWPTKQPILSVVIPYYNRADTIDETLASLAIQTYRSFEIIVVDDGSTEKASINKLQAVKKAYPHIRLLHQANGGVAAARNYGIKESQGKYIICLDSDDKLDDTFVEKALLVLETTPDSSLVTTHQDMFGVLDEVYTKSPYDPIHLYDDNMVITAAAFTKKAWLETGGYKPGIGYEDWEFWLNMAEHGFWGKLIPEPLFHYRTSLQSRYVDDKDVHWANMRAIRGLHPKYKAKVTALKRERGHIHHISDISSALVNIDRDDAYAPIQNGKPNILITVPWMTFGGAETLIYNFCREIKADFNISFITGLKSDHEWEYKFREISPYIYHLANLFEQEELHIEFISHYIRTRKIDILHIIHNGFMFDMLPELKRRHPHLKVAVTVFNDRAPYCEQSIGFADQIDVYAADNGLVTAKYHDRLPAGKAIKLIPNGINAYEEFSQSATDREGMRQELKLKPEEIAAFFVGRLSEEKNPDVFLRVAGKLISDKKAANLRFFMIGDGPMKPEIMNLLKDINNDRIIYLGYQSAVARYLCAADIFVLPSSVEGFPLSILEAMALEVVPIASRVGGVPDVIDEAEDGFVVTPGSVDEIADRLTNLAVGPDLLVEMKRKARRKIEKNFSNRILGDNYRKFYRSIGK